MGYQRKSAIPKEIIQEIKERGILEDHKFDPTQVRKFYAGNIFTRTLAHLIGWTGKKTLRLLCTTAGVLKTAPTGTGFEINITKKGNAPDSYGTAIDFGRAVSRVDFRSWDKDSYFKVSADNITYGDEMEMPANQFYSFDCSIRYLLIKNKVGGQVTRYEFVGWY